MKDNEQTSEHGQRMFDFSTSDISELMKTKLFVDKSLMIKDIFSGSSRFIITAPPRFGKSTNIDMIKRFLEIKVDAQGTPKAVIATKNYRLFKENNLEICKHKKFFNKHFGKHPVVHIDFEPLSSVRDFAHMLEVIRTVIRKSFNQHSYLSNADNHTMSSCWVHGFDIDDFKQHDSDSLIKDVDASALTCGLQYLSVILYKHFGKEVFVLIDNCDAFIKSKLSGEDNNGDTEKIISYITATIDNLLKNNKCVEQALLTGVLPVIGDVSSFNECYIDCYSFMGNHPFCKYFGLTSDEIDDLLGKFVLNEDERTKTKLTIDEFYSGYSTVNRSVQVYNIWSVLQYVCRREVLNYRVYIKSIQPLFRNVCIRGTTSLILVGENKQMDESQTLSTADILELNKIITIGVDNVPLTTHIHSVTDKLLLLLYHFGYLSISNSTAGGFISLQIANESMKYELANVYMEATQIYNENYEILNNIWLSIESIWPVDNDSDQNAMFESFGNAIKAFNGKLYLNDHKMSGILFILYIMLLTKSKHDKALLLTSGTGGNTLYRIVLKNKHSVVICITASCTLDPDVTVHALMTSAKAAHNKIIDSDVQEIFKKYAEFRKRVIIAITSKLHVAGICIAYSYDFRKGQSLNTYKPLILGFGP